jgi:hypothetical protein
MLGRIRIRYAWGRQLRRSACLWAEARLSATVWSGINNGLAMSLVDEAAPTFLIGS